MQQHDGRVWLDSTVGVGGIFNFTLPGAPAQAQRRLEAESAMRQRPILVVEDFDEDFKTVLDAARRSGVVNPIVRASTGEECVRLLQQIFANWLGSVVLPA